MLRYNIIQRNILCYTSAEFWAHGESCIANVWCVTPGDIKYRIFGYINFSYGIIKHLVVLFQEGIDLLDLNTAIGNLNIPGNADCMNETWTISLTEKTTSKSQKCLKTLSSY
jgi:hypothetical protein